MCLYAWSHTNTGFNHLHMSLTLTYVKMQLHCINSTYNIHSAVIYCHCVLKIRQIYLIIHRQSEYGWTLNCNEVIQFFIVVRSSAAYTLRLTYKSEGQCDFSVFIHSIRPAFVCVWCMSTVIEWYSCMWECDGWPCVLASMFPSVVSALWVFDWYVGVLVLLFV